MLIIMPFLWKCCLLCGLMAIIGQWSFALALESALLSGSTASPTTFQPILVAGCFIADEPLIRSHAVTKLSLF